MRYLLFFTPLVLGSCGPPLFAVTGFTQESFSPRADILFVVDNSESMQEEASGLATSFAAFVETLGVDESDFPTDDLSDAVSFYAASTDSGGAFINYQLAVITNLLKNEFVFSDVNAKVSSKVAPTPSRGVPNRSKCFRP